MAVPFKAPPQQPFRNSTILAAPLPADLTNQIGRAPFYVPRPSDDSFWQRLVNFNQAILTPQVTFQLTDPVLISRPNDFEVWLPTIRSNLAGTTVAAATPFILGPSSFDIDDFSVGNINISINRNQSILTPAVTSTPFAPGPASFDVDDFSVGNINTSINRNQSILTTGPSPFTSRLTKFDIDDITIAHRPYQRSIALPFVPNIKVVYWDFNNDDVSPWVQPSQRSIALPFVPAIINRPRLDIDDPAIWQFTIRRNLVETTVTATSPFVPNFTWIFVDDVVLAQRPIQRSIALPFVPSIQNRWRLDPADDQLWSLTLQHNANLTAVTPSPFTIRSPSFLSDDPPLWQGAPIFSKTLPILTANKVIQSHQWLFGYDDASVWSGSPLDSSTVPFFTVGGIIKARQWHWDNDDPSMWSGWTNRNLVNITTAFVPPSPLIPVFYRFHADDPAIWQQPSQRSIGLPFVPPIVDRWRMDIPDDQPWSLSIRYNLAGSVKAPAPFVLRQPQFSIDDPAIWQQPSQRSIGLPFVPVINNRWQLAPADDTSWSFTLRQNQVLSTPIGAPFVVRWRSEINEPALWQRLVFRSIALPTVPAINNRYFRYIPDDQPWTALIHRNTGAMLIITAPPPPFTSRQPSFAFDDHSSYQWPMKSSIILSLKWNINLERIGSTLAERRIILASLERHIVAATPEIRMVGTKIESRIATTTPETRIAIAPDEDIS